LDYLSGKYYANLDPIYQQSFIDLTFEKSSLIITSDTELCGDQIYNNVIIRNNAIVTICDYNGTEGSGTLNFIVSDTFTLEGGSVIEGTGKGGETIGNGNVGERILGLNYHLRLSGSSGAGYGGKGGNGGTSDGKPIPIGGNEYGSNSDSSVFMGSNGRNGIMYNIHSGNWFSYGIGGSGGAILSIDSSVAQIMVQLILMEKVELMQ